MALLRDSGGSDDPPFVSPRFRHSETEFLEKFQEEKKNPTSCFVSSSKWLSEVNQEKIKKNVPDERISTAASAQPLAPRDAHG